jgi:hypothetical protein
MMRRLTRAAFVLGAAALLSLAGSQARAGDPAPFAPLPSGPAAGVPTPAALTAGTPAVDAAAPAAQPKAAMPAAPAAPAAAPVIVAPPAAAGCCAPACEAPCLKKVCVPEQAVRTIDKRVYGDTCEDFCVPKCSLFGGLMKFGGHKHDDCCEGGCSHDSCESGSCPSCEHHVRTRKYLVVKIKHEEECYTKCNVGYEPEAPKCAHGACAAPGGCAETVILPPAAAMPPVEKAPLPKEKK